MEDIRAYIFSITAAAIICGCLTNLLGSKGAASAVTRLIAGAFLAVTVLPPVGTLALDNLQEYWNTFGQDASDAVNTGIQQSHNAATEIIKSQTEAYILDKAAQLEAAIDVIVTLSDDELPAPVAVQLSGSVSPYAKVQLQSMIANDLGIPEENQIWIQ